MNGLPQPIAAALTAQLEGRRAVLCAGARHVGWKIAASMPGVDEHLGPDGIVFGYLTRATVLSAGAVFPAAQARELHAETELAVHLGAGVHANAQVCSVQRAIAGIAVAMELVDTARPAGGTHEMLATNVFHRAVVFGDDRTWNELDSDARAWLRVNETVRAEARVETNVARSVLTLAGLLAATDRRLSAGDRIILGSLTHVPVGPGDAVTAGIDGLGELDASIG
jgi:2-keto-4-pentenoate hydratase